MTKGAVEAVLRRQRTLTLTALALLTLLAWAWLALGAGMGMPAHFDFDLWSTVSRREAMHSGMAMAPAAWDFREFMLAASMWWVMMIAMMLPAAAPVILLHARATGAPATAHPPASAHFLAGYLAVWGAFSLAAAGLQSALHAGGVLAPMTMESTARWLSAVLLIAAGAYQLGPFKEACLSHCRNPAAFLVRHYRPGRSGALRLGTIHGAYCLGCCWMLMALLFVGGVMNLVWIALLTLLVAAEKLMPAGRHIAIAAGLVFISGGVLTLVA